MAEVVRRGVMHPERIAIGGHSYGAFMTANILVHCGDLFACGIAQSGAYNRTLTPFGFQSEQRSFWQAPEVYSTMAPFNNADKIKTPILLVHGEADNNTGAHSETHIFKERVTCAQLQRVRVMTAFSHSFTGAHVYVRGPQAAVLRDWMFSAKLSGMSWNLCVAVMTPSGTWLVHTQVMVWACARGML